MGDENCERIRESLEAYALGALDEGDRAEVERHLAGCPECRRIADELAEVAATLPHALAAASPLRPPEALARRVFDRVAHEAGGRGAHGSQRRALRPGLVGLAAAVVVAVVVSLAWNARLSDALSKERSLRARIATLTDNQAIVLDVVDSRETVRVFLGPPEGSTSSAYGKIFTRPDLPYVVVMANRLPQPPPGRAYRVWVTRAGHERALGSLALNADGFGLFVRRSAERSYDSARVVLQPRESTTSAGRIVLLGRPSPG